MTRSTGTVDAIPIITPHDEEGHLMTSQQLILGLIAIAILVILLIPTLVIKTRKERKLPGEPKPVTKGRRFCALLIDVICVSALTGIG
ncbi:hypothetical protein TPCV302_03380 [Cutibacterium avidum]|nr:hypothetical protein TPCV302_03380 [Cutibacterium avidum]